MLQLIVLGFLKSVSPQYFDRYGSFQIKHILSGSISIIMSGDNGELAELERYRLWFIESIDGAEQHLESALGELRSLRHRLGCLKRRMMFLEQQ